MRALIGRDGTGHPVARGRRGATVGPRAGRPGGWRDRRAARAALGLTLLAVLVAGCSNGGADSGGASMTDTRAFSGEDSVAGGGDAGAAAADVGDDAAADPGADAAGRQVVTTGDVALTASDPRGAADGVVALVEEAGGRVDARQESSARAEDGTDASADLTVRVPADDVSDLLDALEDLGDVQDVDLRSEDVTAAAQDLDARIRAMRLSVARMEDLLAGAATQADVISAENTLTERQAALEQLESQRARVAEQVALSTLHVMIWSDGAPAPTTDERTGFLGGLAAGWEALVGVLGVALLVLGALVPWLAVAALVVAAVVAVRRVLRRRGARRGPDAGAPDAGGPDVGEPGGGTAGPHEPAVVGGARD